MRKIVLSSLLIIGVIIAALVLKKDDNKSENSPQGIGDPEDPFARINYEIERLANPLTGKIPEGIRKRELEFAKKLPKKNSAKTLSWSELGPGNRGGRTRAIAIDIASENIVLAGAVTGGMFRSINGGASFVKTTDPGQMHSVTCIAQDVRPGHENVWYYGTGENYGVVSGTSFSSLYSGDGIFKSTDGGQSWTKLASTSSGTPETQETSGEFDFVSNVVTDHTNLLQDVVLASVYNGIYRSTDGGDSWTLVLGSETSAAGSDYVELEKTSTGIFYASFSTDGSSKGLYRSEDGVNWVNITPGAFPTSYRRIVIGISPADETQVYFFGETTGGTNGHSLFKYHYLSGDGSGAGGEWIDLTSNLPNGTCSGYFDFNFARINTQNSFDMCIAMHPTDTAVVFIGGTNIYRSTNGFYSIDSTEWIGGYQCDTINPLNYVTPGHHPDQHRMVFLPSNPSVMYSASDGGVHKTNNCMTTPVVWEDLDNGYVTSQFYTVSLEEGDVNSDIAIGGTQDNGCWMTDQNSFSPWYYTHIDDGAYCAIPEEMDYILVSSQRGRVYKKTLDAGYNITGYERIDPDFVGNNYNFINPFILDPTNDNRLYIMSKIGVYRHNDVAGIPVTDNWFDEATTGWETVPNSSNGAGVGFFSQIAMSRADENTLFLGTNVGRIFRINNVLDAETEKVNITGSNMPFVAYTSCIATNDFDPDELMVTFSNYEVKSIFHSLDGGETWEDVGGNLEENPDGSGSGPGVYWASIYPGYPHKYFVATSVGLFSTELLDGANTIWEQEGADDIGNVVINMVKTRTHDGKIVVATHGNGMYGSALSPAFVSDNEIINDNEIIAYNYPNPFSEKMTLEFILEKSERVNVSIYDLNGKKVKQLSDKIFSEGKHQLTWDGSNDMGLRETGNYLYVLKTATKKLTRKITFVN